jgi:hypothetical protein
MASLNGLVKLVGVFSNTVYFIQRSKVCHGVYALAVSNECGMGKTYILFAKEVY